MNRPSISKKHLTPTERNPLLRHTIVLLLALVSTFLLTSLQTSSAQTIQQGTKNSKAPKKHHKRIKRPAKIDGYVTLSSYYDDNVFRYSDSDRTVFTSGTKPERFPIDQIDDFVTSIAARSYLAWNRKKHSNWRMLLRYDASIYQSNSFRNNNQFGVELRRKKRHSYTEIAVLWNPDYYLRHLFWSPTKSSTPRTATDPIYAPANLSKIGFYFEHERRLKRRLYARLHVGYITKNYDAPFDERDNKTYSVAFRMRKIFGRRFEGYIGGSLDFVSSSASDYNIVGISDIGNRETGFRTGFEVKLDRRGKFIWNESFSYRHQSYNTSDLADRFHYNRTDDEVFVGSRLTWRVYPGWQPRLSYTLSNSSTNVQTGVSDVGAFSANRFGVQVLHYF